MKKALLSLAIIIVSGLGLIGIARAANNPVSELTKDASTSGLYIRAAERVVIAGTVEGDVWVAGSSIEITGTVNGNVHAAGEKIVITGSVNGSVYAAGSSVRMEGKVLGTVYAAGSTVETTDSFRGSHAAVLGGSTLTFKGSVLQQLYAGGSNLIIDGQIGQSARVEATTIIVGSQASIAGDFKYSAANNPQIANDRAIQGKLVREESLQKNIPKNPIRDRLIWAMVSFGMMVVLAAVMLRYAPRIISGNRQAFLASPIQNSLKGLAFVVFVPVAIILGMITVVGIPAMVLALLVYISTLILAPIAISWLIGTTINRSTAGGRDLNSYNQQLLATVVGIVCYTILTIVPYVGDLIGFILLVAGTGLIIARGFGPLTGSAPTKAAKTRLAKA